MVSQSESQIRCSGAVSRIFSTDCYSQNYWYEQRLSALMEKINEGKYKGHSLHSLQKKKDWGYI